MSGSIERLDPATASLVRAAYASTADLVDVEDPGVALAAFETVCGVCHLAHNRALSCTNCSGRG